MPPVVSVGSRVAYLARDRAAKGVGCELGRDREIGVGMLGYAFMGKALRERLQQDLVHDLRRRSARRGDRGPRREAVSEAAERFGFDRWTMSWEDLMSDPRRALRQPHPNSLHAEPTISAAEPGSTSCARSRSGATRGELRDLAPGGSDRSEAPLCLQLPLRTTQSRLAREMIDAGDSKPEIATFAGDISRTGAIRPSRCGGSTARLQAPGLSATSPAP